MKPSPHPPRAHLRLRSNPSFLFWAVLAALFAFVPALVPSASAAPSKCSTTSRAAPMAERQRVWWRTRTVLKLTPKK